MTAADTYDRLPDAVTDIFGEDATAAYAYDLLTVDVPASSWIAALETARDELGCGYFDWLSAVDEPGTGFLVCAHVAAPSSGRVRRLLVRTTVPHEAPALPSAIDVYAGAAWHERETYEMFGVRFEDHPHLVPLLLPEGFEGHPLRKDFVLAARVAKAWPGAKEPGESEHGGPKRRTMLPPGVPDPNEWGPLKGQLPPAPARPARGARAAGDRPVRRARTASEGSAAQRPAAPDATAPDATAGATAPDATATPQAAASRRSRSVSQGSASQSAEPAAPTTEPSPPAAAGGEAAPPSDAAQAPAPPQATEAGAAPAPADAGPAGTEPTSTRAPRAVRSTDAPWHHARPAFDDVPSGGATDSPEPGATAPDAGPAPEAAPDQAAGAGTTGAEAAEPEAAEPEAGVTEPEPQPEPGASALEAEGESGERPEPPSAPAPAPQGESGAGSEPESSPEPGSSPEAGSSPEPEPGPEAERGPDPQSDPRTDRPAGGDTA